jgi:hypothetical protein
VPTGLIPISALGAAAGVRTPTIDALVEIVRNMTGKDFQLRGARSSGWSGIDAAQIHRVVEAGFS